MRQLAVPVSSLSKGISSTLDFTRALVLTGLELANFHTVSERLIDVAPGPGGHWPRKGVWVVRPWRPPFHASPVVRKGPISSKRVSSQEPLLRNLEILASTASIFTQNLAHKPPNLETFSSQGPNLGNFQFTSPFSEANISSQAQIWKVSVHKSPFSEANISSQAPHFGNSGRTPLPENSWVPPGGI